jgi:superfamily II DNA or RNA helicase
VKIIQDNTIATVVFDGEPQKLKDRIDEYLYDELSEDIPGAQFSPSVRSGRWDGKSHFYDKKSHSFASGLINRATLVLDKVRFLWEFTYQVVDNRPDSFANEENIRDAYTLEKGKFKLRDYQENAVNKIFSSGHGGIVNYGTGTGKTGVGAAAIKALLPSLKSDERIAMFTNNKEIFRQNKENLEKLLGMKIGYLGGGKKKIAKVMVCMIPTVDSYLKIEPTKGLSYSPKERQIQKMAIDYREKFIHTVNPYAELKSFVRMFRPIKKVDYKTKETLEDILYSCGSNEDVVRAFNQKLEEYNKIVYKKAKEKVDKKKFIEDLLDSFVMFIADECHHSRADTWYNVLLSCRNAVYKVGLSGSIDQDDKLTWARLQGVFGGIIAKLKAKKLIDEGLLAKPTIIMANVESPGDIVGLKKWQDIYKAGIVENEYRNSLIAGLAKQSYDSGKTTLIIVSQIAHSDNISNNLQDLGVPYEVINGTQEDDDRKSELNRVKTGHTRVLIATSVLDEGVDISNIDVLIMAAGGKSMRQAIQRVGRVLRKKENKENKATIFDFYDDTNRILRNHSQERLDIYEEQEFEIKRVGD